MGITGIVGILGILEVLWAFLPVGLCIFHSLEELGHQLLQCDKANQKV